MKLLSMSLMESVEETNIWGRRVDQQSRCQGRNFVNIQETPQECPAVLSKSTVSFDGELEVYVVLISTLFHAIVKN